MEFSTNLSEYRLKKKLSQKQLAELMNVSTGTVAEWESGEVMPSVQQLCDLSKLLNVSIDELLGNGCETPTAKTELANITLIKESKKSRHKTPLIISTVLLLLIVLLVVLQPWKKSFSQNTEAIEVASDSVVKVICYNQFGDVIASGSGFALFDDHTFITNYHVIEDAYAVKICSDDDVMFNVNSIRDYSEDYDIAILIVDDSTSIQPLNFDENYEIKRGESIIAIGSPLGIKNTVSQGNFSGHVFEDPVQVLQFTAPISSGSSGGALFNDKGDVIGITFASYIDGQNLNLAIPINYAVDMYQNAKFTKATLRTDFIKYPLLTIQELISSYSYDESEFKEVRINGYISSIAPEKNPYSSNALQQFWGQSSRGFFVSESPYVEGDFIYDDQLWKTSNYSECPVVFVPCGIEDIGSLIGCPVSIAGQIFSRENNNGSIRLSINGASYYIFED